MHQQHLHQQWKADLDMAKGRVTISTDCCKGCNLCVSVCPVNILELSKANVNAIGYYPAVVVEPERCIGCMFCALICPDVCIEVERLTP